MSKSSSKSSSKGKGEKRSQPSSSNTQPPRPIIVFPGDELAIKSGRIVDGIDRNLHYPSIISSPSSVSNTLSSSPSSSLTDSSSSSSPSSSSFSSSYHSNRAGFYLRHHPSTPSTPRPFIFSPNRKSYTPSIDDCILAIVIEEGVEYYRCDIGTHGSDPYWPASSAATALLPVLAFEGATKRNRPQLRAGSLVYCRVSSINKHSEIELSCISPLFKKDWVTGESLFGELTGGYLLRHQSLGLCEELLDEKNYLLPKLAKYVPFEIAVGRNGRIWINSLSSTHVVILSNAIANSYQLPPPIIDKMVKKLFEAISQ